MAAGMVVWFIGVGVFAHAVPHMLDSDEMPDVVRIGISRQPERVAVLMAIVVVSWPLSVPALTVMMKVRQKKEKE